MDAASRFSTLNIEGLVLAFVCCGMVLQVEGFARAVRISRNPKLKGLSGLCGSGRGLSSVRYKKESRAS